MKWRPIFIGLVLGAVVAFVVGGKQKGTLAQADYGSSMGSKNVTGKFAQPFQWGIDKG